MIQNRVWLVIAEVIGAAEKAMDRVCKEQLQNYPNCISTHETAKVVSFPVKELTSQIEKAVCKPCVRGWPLWRSTLIVQKETLRE